MDNSLQLVSLVDSTTRYCKINKSNLTAKIITNSIGEMYKFPQIRKITLDQIVSDRPIKTEITPTIYCFTECYNKFLVNKSIMDDPLIKTSENALGSGIYGVYIKDLDDLANFDNVTKIDFANPLYLQDKEHGESLTNASIVTNRFLDKIIQQERFGDSYDLGDINNIVNLWNIVLARIDLSIETDWLREIFVNYVNKYLYEPNFNVLPINEILGSLGYDGIIADDAFNNNAERGCVKFVN